jgi:ABC-type branched-subunit amino acid transport system substrate-binding protein
MKKFLVSLCMVLALVACKEEKKEETQADTKPVVKIGVLYPLSGDSAFFGDSAKKAADLFFKEFDATKFKYKYQLIWEDSQSSPAKAAMAARKLIDYDHVDVIYDMHSGVSIAISPIANEKKTIHLAFAQDRAISTGFYNWRVVTSTKKTGEKMLSALKKRKLLNIVGVVENIAGTMSLYGGFENAAKQDKDMSLETMSINPGERDFNLLLQKIQNKKPDAIVVSLHAPEIDIFMRQAKSNEINIPIVGVQSFTFLKDKSLAEGSWYVDVAMADKDFLERYKASSGDDITNFAENFYTLLQVTTTIYESFDGKEKPTHEEFIAKIPVLNGVISPIGKLVVDKEEQNVDSEASIRAIKNGIVEAIEE